MNNHNNMFDRLTQFIGNFLRPREKPVSPEASRESQAWADFYNQEAKKNASSQLSFGQNLQQPSPTASPRRIPRVQGSSTIDPKVEQFLTQTVFPITRKYKIPDPIAAGQFAAEGRFKGLGAARNNFFNINAVDSNPNAAYRYSSPQDGVEAYAQLLQRRYAKALEEQDVIRALQMIEQLGYAGDPRTYGQRSDSGFNSYAEFIRNTPEFRYFYQP